MSLGAVHREVVIPSGVRLHWLETGSGRPLVMIPGWSQTAATFRRQFDSLSEVRRVMALDMRGHGESSKPEGGYRISRLAIDLAEFLDVAGLDEVDLLGHSMGCSVIWSYFDLFGDSRVSQFVNVEQSRRLTGRPAWSEEECRVRGCLFWDVDDVDASLKTVPDVADVESKADAMSSMFTADIPRDELEWIASENLKMPRPAAAQLAYDHALSDWTTAIQSIDVPTLVVSGKASFFSIESQQWVADQIPGAEHVIFEADEGGSHFMFWENPNKFNKALTDFLQ
jgi:non-heme chloroperoxidase